MKTYKLNGIEYYTVAFSKGDAVEVFWLHGIGVTETNVVETDIEPNREAIGNVFRSLVEMEEFNTEYGFGD